MKSIIKVLQIACISALYALLLLLIIGVTAIDNVTIGGKPYDASVETLTISDADFLNYDNYSFMRGFRRLKLLDVSQLDVSTEKYESIASGLNKDANVLWNVPYGGGVLPSDCENLTISSKLSEADIRSLSFFYNLKEIEFGELPIKDLYETVKAVRTSNLDLPLTYRTNIHGVEIDNSSEVVCLDNIPLKNTSEVKMAIELFPGIKKFEMCDCGISDEKMAELRDAYPDVKFKWMLHILIYDIPTDTQVFSTLVGNWVAYADENTFAPIFKYCTDLRALDLGHWDYIGDISEIRNLKNLEILIISDNCISDISPLADLKHLKYMDLRYNKITDVTPLTQLQELQFLEIGGNKLKNAELLCECRSLKFLYIEGGIISGDAIKALNKGLPEGCEFKMKNTRGHEWYRRIIKMFRRWKQVKVYHDWENVEYYDE